MAAQVIPDSMLMDYFEEPYVVIMGYHKEDARILQEYLERQGFRGKIAYDVKTTERLIYETHPDLLILDVDVPDLAIFEMIQQVKHDFQHIGTLPVMMLTDMQEEHIRLAGMLAVDECLYKPIILRDLLLRVQALMWHKRQIDRLHYEKHQLTQDLLQRQEQLREAQEAAFQIRLIQRHFTHNINHEFRTPLLQIKSSVAMLTKLLHEKLADPQAQTLADMATQATARLEYIFQNIAQFEVFENIKADDYFVLHHAINASLKHFQRSWAYQNATERIKTFLGVDLPPVRGDQRAVKQILIKLIENALKFSSSTSQVEVSLRWHKGDNKAWVGVRDYGIGIAPQDMQRIFEPYVQVDGSSTREYGGLGLGLTIAQSLAKGLSTVINVESELGKGSVFWFTLPVASFETDSTETPQEE